MMEPDCSSTKHSSSSTTGLLLYYLDAKAGIHMQQGFVTSHSTPKKEVFQ